MGKKTYIDFIPQPDMTAYELALILKAGVKFEFPAKAFEELPLQAKRHFKVPETHE